MVQKFPMKKQKYMGRNSNRILLGLWRRGWSALLCMALALSLTAPTRAAYNDVPAGHWAAGDIQYVTKRGLFNGTTPATFGPSEKMTRAMLATVLYRYAGSPAVSGTTPYADVPAGAWYTPGVSWACQNSIFPSVNLSRTMLYPNEDVRRAEFCVMLYNFAKSLGKANADPAVMERAPFTDMEWNRFSMAGFGPIYNEAREAMLGWAWPVGIMNGTTATTIDPLGSITRAEVAAMLTRFDQKVLGGTEPAVQQPITNPEPEPVQTPNTGSDGSTVLTEETVRAAIKSLRERYPHGAVYETPYRPNTGLDRPFSNCDHCAGWAMLCSDAAFGNLPWQRVNSPSWESIRVGDVVAYKNSYSGHAIVVLDKTDEFVTFTESSIDNKVMWSAQYPRWWLEKQPGLTLYTRYPN